jgi:hypothetical protein
MNMRVAFGFFALSAPLALLAAQSSCNPETQNDEPCTGIPAGGCPLAHGTACDDPACDRVYACRADNVWELDHVCPPHEAGAQVDATALDDAASEASLAFDANIDAPPGAAGGPGCTQLEAPDCPLALVLACQSGCCGCEDLFVCESGGWNYYATCGE